MTPTALMLVFTGAGLGGVLRYAATFGISRITGPAFPYGTLAVNLLGGLVIGFLVGLWAGQSATHAVSPQTRAFLVTGILGGFTTFSAFTLDSVTLIERQQTPLALAYILASVCGAVLALVAGQWLGRNLAV